MSHNDLFQTSLGVFGGGAKMMSLLKLRVLASLLTSRVSCFGPWARENFPAPLKQNNLCLIGKKELSYFWLNECLVFLFQTPLGVFGGGAKMM